MHNRGAGKAKSKRGQKGKLYKKADTEKGERKLKGDREKRSLSKGGKIERTKSSASSIPGTS